MSHRAPGVTEHRGVLARARAVVGALVLVLAVAVPGAMADSAHAASPVSSGTQALAAEPATDFQPGLVISDSLFYDSNAMSAGEIQDFLDGQIGTCGNRNCLNIVSIDYPGRARDVSSSTGQLICEAIPAGTVRVSELIYRAQVACGISAKVILVTLQKEQGLVTSRAPSDVALRWAMGMACPDTAPCDTAFAGLGTQIVSGTRQLKVYKAASFARQPGRHWIGYNPNSACGGTYVDIENYATAALYNYTPYQPNAAALANPYGLGDSCSSYGTRNFWIYFTDWFGSTTGGGRVAIDAAYDAAGGAAVLGAGVAYLDCPIRANRCWPLYERGSIYWSPGTGADIVLGSKDAAYRAIGGPDSPLGYPITGEYEYVENGGGSAQVFQKGSLFESASGIFPTYGAVRTAYFAQQGAWGYLGWPTSGVRCVGANCSQIFEHGAIAVIGSSVTYIDQQERDVWVAAGGITGTLGAVVSDEIAYTENGGGTTRIFSGGSIFTSPDGTFAVTEPIKTPYFDQRGAWGGLGWPSSVRTCVPGGCWQRFQNGAIVTNGPSSYQFTKSEFDAYLIAGGPGGVLGLPTSSSFTYTENGGGTARIYAQGTLFRSAAGSFAVTEPIRSLYFAQRGAWGPLGWPVAAMSCQDGTCTQRFQGGTLSAAAPGTVAPPTESPDDEQAQIHSQRIASIAMQQNLGGPTSGLLAYTENGGGYARVYGGTTVFSSDAGAFAVSGGVRSAYFAQRGAWGALGWPTAGQRCMQGGCYQAFQNGTIFAGDSSAVILSGAELDAFTDLGGPSGPLGFPVSDLLTYSQNGGGTARVFTRGSIFTSAAGSFAVTEPVRAAYFARQGAWGSLGWPTSAPVARDGANVQFFQNGAVVVNRAGVSYLDAAEVQIWQDAGGPDGTLGVPTSGLLTYTQNGGGTARVYTGGSIFASSAGSFAVVEPIRAAYFAKQGAWGELGWPTTAAVVDGGVTTQGFEHGTIAVAAGVAHYLTPAEAEVWAATGGATGPLGAPVQVDGYAENGGGTARIFAGGTIFTSASGTFAVLPPVRAVYFAAGGATGSYGWPTAAMACDSGTCTQEFQGGTVSAPAS
ncbi:MAG: hypothetical protein J0G30_05815 [Actinomycetales bacterium]|nr:hypothetical protein [Actinomycetales bacterium]